MFPCYTSWVAKLQHLICDLDGVVWSGNEMIEGSATALSELHRQGVSIWFVTNNSNRLPSHYLERLQRAGIDHQGQIITSAQAAASMLHEGERVLICGGPGVEGAVTEVGAIAVSNSADEQEVPVDAVIVGLHTDFDYEKLHRASRAVRRGARLIGTNSDVTFPTASGEAPGGGAILAAVEAASGQVAQLAGKPHEPMAEALRQQIGTFDPTAAVMVGDRYTTDGRFADRLGCRFLAVSSGVAPDAVDVSVWHESPCLRDALPQLIGEL